MPTETQYQCPECGRTFGESKALGAHRYRAHGVRGKQSKAAHAARKEADAQLSEEFVEELNDLAAPLQAEVDRLRAQLAKIDTERHEVIGKLSRLDGALKRLLPEPEPKTTRSPQHQAADIRYPASEEQVAEVLRFIESNYNNGEGFTPTLLAGAMHGHVSFGEGKVKSSVMKLHERGVIRFDRMVKGGGKQYKLVGGGANGSSPS